jgi:hypothetical protein
MTILLRSGIHALPSYAGDTSLAGWLPFLKATCEELTSTSDKQLSRCPTIRNMRPQ